MSLWHFKDVIIQILDCVELKQMWSLLINRFEKKTHSTGADTVGTHMISVVARLWRDQYGFISLKIKLLI